MIGIDLQSSFVELLCFFDVHCTSELLKSTELIEAVCIARVVFERYLKVFLCFLVLSVVVKRCCQIVVTLR